MASEPETGETVSGTPTMRRVPASEAMARAASVTDWPLRALTLAGMIHTLSSPRYHAMEPDPMRTSAPTLRSFTVTRSVPGKSRSMETEATQGFLESSAWICPSSTLRRVVPSGTVRRFWMSAMVTCSVASVSMLWISKTGAFLSTR